MSEVVSEKSVASQPTGVEKVREIVAGDDQVHYLLEHSLRLLLHLVRNSANWTT